VAVILLLPCFFVFTGLKTEIDFNDPYLWKVTGAIILVAVVGKFRKCIRKICWTELKDSLTIGS
jgi:Kef-type K+ transport system membrane component KefB